MSSTVSGAIPAEVTRYADAVFASLSDVAPAAREEILEDLVGHLREVAAESDGPLEARLGTPQAYAVELRSSLGLTPLEKPPAVSTLETLRRAYDTGRATRLGAELEAFVPTLRPAWWLLRAWFVVLVFAVLSGFRGQEPFSVLLPRLGESRLLGILALLLLAAASVKLGQRDIPARRHDALLIANIVIVIAGLVAAMTLYERSSYGYVMSPAVNQPARNDQGQPVVLDRNGNPVSNLEVRTPEGKRIDRVLIYTQNGLPLDNLESIGYDEQGRELVMHPERDAAGNVVRNSYPRHYDVLDPVTNELSPTPRPSAPPTAPTAPTTPTATGSATPTATPMAASPAGRRASP